MFNAKPILDLISLILLNLKINISQFFDYLYTFVKYYPHNNFFKSDLCLLSQYLFKNPFRISRNFLQNQGAKEIYAYGETPLHLFEIITKKCHITEKDYFFELGCGRGRTCFWLNSMIKCTVIGIDFVPEFIKKAQRVKKICKLKNIEFRLEDFVSSDLSKGTVFYLYGICLPEQTIVHLVKCFAQLPTGVKFITMSYALNDYTEDKNLFKILDVFELLFPWGKGLVFFQEKL